MSLWSRSSIPFPAIDLIQAVAPFNPNPGQTPGGTWVIGYGMPVDQFGRAVTAESAAISQSQAANVLTAQMPSLLKAVGEVVWVPIQEYQVAALISLIADPDAGPGALANSPLISMLNAGQAALAQGQFSRWVMISSGGAISASVPKMIRRAIEADVFGGADVANAVAAVDLLTQAQLLALKTTGDAAAATWLTAPTAVSVTSGASTVVSAAASSGASSVSGAASVTGASTVAGASTVTGGS